MNLIDHFHGIDAAQTRLEEILREKANQIENVSAAFRGGNVNGTAWWNEEHGFWFMGEHREDCYWNTFGLEKPRAGKSANSACEINVATTGFKKVSGAFVNDNHGGTWLVHRGIFGGGRRGVTKQLAKKHFKNRWRQMDEPSDKDPDPVKTDVILIGKLEAEDFLDSLSSFLVEVQKFKTKAGVTDKVDDEDDGEDETDVVYERVRPFARELPPIDERNGYTFEQLCEETGFSKELLSEWVNTLKNHRQIVLYGPPGTGKTYLAERIAKYLASTPTGFSDLVQFHASFGYEDFIEGLRPVPTERGGLDYKYISGRFIEFCTRVQDGNVPGVLIIDEINRANVTKVFGELLYLLERRKQPAKLASGTKFSVPEEAYIIGTMNTADRSIALVDLAFRRRFAFIRVAPNFDLLRSRLSQKSINIAGLISVLQSINTGLIRDQNYWIGHSYFIDMEKRKEDIRVTWQLQIEPYLEELLFNHEEKLADYRWENVRSQILR